MNTKRILAIGCGCVVFIGLTVAALIILFVAHVAKDPEGLKIAVAAPTTVACGQEFELVVSVINERRNKPLQVDTIDIGEEYLNGFTVVSAEPPFVASTMIAIDDSRSYEFKHSIAPGATNRFVFKLQARKTGRFSGELDVCEGMRFLTMVVETQVE